MVAACKRSGGVGPVAALTCAALVVACGSARAWAAPAWFDEKKQRGFAPDVADFYQHQAFSDVTTDNEAGNWETFYPNREVYKHFATAAGICRDAAIVDVLARLEKNGFKGVTEADINKGEGKWQAAMVKAEKAMTAATGVVNGVRTYLDGRKPAAMIPDGSGGMMPNPDRWAGGLKLDQFVVMQSDTANTAEGSKNFKKGQVLIGAKVATAGPDKGKIVEGLVYQEKGKDVDAFTATKRLLAAEQNPLATVVKAAGTEYSKTLWWSNFHTMAVAGVSEKDADGAAQFRLYVADPDSNPEHNADGTLVAGTGNRSAKAGYDVGSAKSADAGDGGWTFLQQKRGETTANGRYTFIKPTDGTVVDLQKLIDDGEKVTFLKGLNETRTMIVPQYINDATMAMPGTVVVQKKADEQNVAKRKFGEKDLLVPSVKTTNDATVPGAADISRRLTTLQFDTSAPDKAMKVAASDEFSGAINDKGKYTGLNLGRVETIGLKAVKDALGARPIIVGERPGLASIVTPLTLISSIAETVDKFQIVSATGPASDDMGLDGMAISDTAGGLWRASFMPPSPVATDAWGNPLLTGGWQFDYESGGMFGGLPAVNVLDPDSVVELPAFMSTLASLQSFFVFSHNQARTDLEGNMFGDYWLAQAYGLDEDVIEPQLEALADDVLVPGPGAAGLMAAALGVFCRRRRGL
ncbi:MAG: hypothetical protein ACKVS8_02005 [Phycisphaerales bacterium]